MIAVKDCQTCVKLTTCKIFEQASAIKAEFDARHGAISTLPMIPEALAIKCTEFVDIRKTDAVNVQVAREFLFEEIEEAKKTQNEGRLVKLHKVIRDMDEIEEGGLEA